jgi:membrane protein DedA with SNARE-associated domain
MWWHYLLVFVGSFLFDVVPIPFPPAFTVMVFLQIMFGLNIWWVVIIGVAGSILGRYILTLYIPFLAGKIFKRSKNEDVEFLGKKMKEKGWRSQLVIIGYSLLPLPTTPLFLAGGMAKIKPLHIIPAFFIGKFISDAITVHLGKYASEHAKSILEEALSWKSITSLVVGLLLICALLFIDWRSLIQKNKFQLKFKIWK